MKDAVKPKPIEPGEPVIMTEKGYFATSYKDKEGKWVHAVRVEGEWVDAVLWYTNQERVPIHRRGDPKPVPATEVSERTGMTRDQFLAISSKVFAEAIVYILREKLTEEQFERCVKNDSVQVD